METNDSPMNDLPSCNTWRPIVTYVLIFLNIMISICKQFLNNNKHIKLNNNIDTILTGIKRNNLNTNNLITEGEGLINLNILEHLKTSQKANFEDLIFPCLFFFPFMKIVPNRKFPIRKYRPNGYYIQRTK